MKFSLKAKNVHVLIFSLTCLIVIFTLYQSFNYNSPTDLRKLIEPEKVDERCKKASKDFKEKYSFSPDEFEMENITSLKNYQEVLKEIIEDKQYGKIKKYLPKVLVYLIIAIIDIIFIIFWILFCCYSCKNVEKQNRIGCGAKCCFILFFILCIAIIIFCVIGIIYTPYVFKAINGLACSIYRPVFHFLEGINSDNKYLNWTGLNQIHSNLTNLNQNKYKNSKDIIDSMISTLNEINDKTLEDIECIMKSLDDYYPYNSILLFGGIGIFNLLGLLAMFLIFVCECKCMSCLFHFFWNIEIIFIIATFFLSAIFGSFSVVSKDVSKILINQIQKVNLENPNNQFIVNYTEISNEIDLCINGNGDLYTYLFKDNGNDFYNDLRKKDASLNKNDLMSQYNCTFFKMDYTILVEHLDDQIAKKLYFLSLLFIIVDVAGIISIFFGITIYNSQKAYYPPNSSEVNVNNNRLPGNRIDLSTENLKRQNNEIIFSKNKN